MTKRQRLVIAGLLTALLALLFAVAWKLVERFGWYAASIYAISALWVVAMGGMIIGDAIHFYMKRKR